MSATQQQAYVLAPTPNTADLQSVDPLPFDTRTEWFDNRDTLITADAADAIISEIWRLSRNPRLLEIEQAVRGEMMAELQLSFLAAGHIEDGVLDPTKVAQAFIATVRDEYSHRLSDGPTASWAVTACPTELDTLTIE